MYDIAIIGAGPAGLSAGITARSRNKSVVIISNKPQDSPLAKATLVNNYPGMPHVSGLELLISMEDHARSLGCEFILGSVISVLPLGEKHFSITLGTEHIEARSVILAVGTSINRKPFVGEEEFLGKGVSYCATCDGMFYRNATVCVVDLNPEAFEEALFLAEIGATVHFFTRKTLPAHDCPSNLIVRKARLLEIKGDALGVVGVRIAEKLDQGTKEQEVPCQGVFIPYSPTATALLSALDLKDGLISVDAQMRTNVPGLFAAGDCTGKPLQIAKAVGEGQIACFSAVEYL